MLETPLIPLLGWFLALTALAALAFGWRRGTAGSGSVRDHEHERLVSTVLALFYAGDRALMMLDEQGRLESFNPLAYERIQRSFGFRLHVGLTLGHLLPPKALKRAQACFRQALAGQEPATELRFTAPGGAHLRIMLRLMPVFDGDGQVRSIAVSLDPLDRLEKAEEALRKSGEGFVLAAKGSMDGLWDLDLHGLKLSVTARWEAQAGLREGLGPKTYAQWLELVHPDDRGRLNERMQAHRLGVSDRFECEYRLRHSDGDWIWMLARGKAEDDERGVPLRMAGSQTDVHQAKLREADLVRDALRDPLTGLPNRALILDRLDHCLAKSRRDADYRFAIVYLDVDNFKTLFRTLGQQGSEEVLKAVAKRLQGLVRPGDTVARLGSGEFALLLDSLEREGAAQAVAVRVLEDARKALTVLGRECYVTLSVGLAESHAELQGPVELLRDGETAMVQAKAIPRGLQRLAVFDKSMHQAAVTKHALELELRKALDEGDVQMHFQPLVDLESGDLLGFEALARWQHPERGMIPPGEFVPVAEECGLILSLGRLALRQGLDALADWGAQAQGLKMSVNLSPHQLDDPLFLPTLEAALQGSGVAPAQLQLEITEGILMAKGPAALDALERLRGLGITIAIDDFGTGYSSLSYLHRFPADTLKIDRAFISRMDGLPENEAVTGAIIALGLNLGMSLVAEGIETPTQAKRLRALGCQGGQGYWFGKAMPKEEAAALLGRRFEIPEL
jgi:diguanylate cyclase (GGDEF)-like protein/PAS domain S-box-containing protein